MALTVAWVGTPAGWGLEDSLDRWVGRLLFRHSGLTSPGPTAHLKAA